MPPRLASSRPARHVEIHTLCAWATSRGLVGAVAARQLSSRADAELAVDPGEIRFDGSDADDELGGDLLVRLSLGDEGRDPLFRRRQLGRRAGATADAGDFSSRLLGSRK